MENPKLRPVEAVPVDVGGRRMIALQDPQGFCSDTVMVNSRTFFLLSLFDGSHSISEIQVAYSRKFGDLMFSDKIIELVNDLDSKHLMASDSFEMHKKELEGRFKGEAAVISRHCGKSYPADPDTLKDELAGFFPLNVTAAGSASADPAHVKGIVAPHIDFRRGGSTYAEAYRAVVQDTECRLFILLGTSHTPTENRFVVTDKNFQTPLGMVHTDKEMVKKLFDSSSCRLDEESFLFCSEHSLDFQVLLLSYIFQEKLETIRIIPVLCGGFGDLVNARKIPQEDPEIEKMASSLKEIIGENQGGACVIAGADLSHKGLKFGDPHGLSAGTLSSLADEDKRMLALAEKVDSTGFFRNVADDGDSRRVCGLAPIYMTLRLMEGTVGRLAGYQQCIDPAGHSVVTIASMHFR